MDEPSPISRYLDAKYAPPDEEAHIVREYIASTKAAVADLDERIEEMKAGVVAIQAEKERQLKDIARASNLLSPIRRLPVEVITSIFLQYLEESNPKTLHNHPSVTISHVSQYWRGLALSTPLLWSQIHATVPRRSNNLGKLQHMVDAWTERSLACPIHLYMTCGDRDASVLLGPSLRPERERSRTFVDSLFASSRRWVYVNFTITFDPRSEDIVALFKRPPREYESLRRADVTLRDDFRSPPPVVESWISNLASSPMFGAPSLTSVSFPGLWGNVAAARSLSPIPLYAFVTTLRFEGTAIYATDDIGSFRERIFPWGSFAAFEVLEVLRSFPLLVHCHLRLWNIHHIVVAREPVSLPHLTSMTFLGYTVNKGLAPSLRLPRLATLRFLGPNVPDMPIQRGSNGVIEFLSIFGPQLSEFTLLPEVIPPLSILPCLQSVPNVRRLTISCKSTTSAAHQAVDLACFNALCTLSVCPKLKTFKMDGARNVREDGTMEKALAKMVILRRTGGCSETLPGTEFEPSTKIHHINVRFADAQKVDVVSNLRENNVDLGNMYLKIKYPPPKL